MIKDSIIKIGLSIGLLPTCFGLIQGQGKEDFTGAKQSGTSYKTIEWVGNNGLNWSATEAVGNKDLDGDAITLRYGAIKGRLTEDQKIGGIGSITFDAKIVFSDMDKDFFILFESGNVQKRLSLGRFNAKDSVVHFGPFEVNACNVSEFELGLNTIKGSGKLTIDNLAWTAVKEGNCDKGLQYPESKYKLRILNPKEGESINGKELILNFDFPNMEGKTASMTITDLASGIYKMKATSYFSLYPKSVLDQEEISFSSYIETDTKGLKTDSKWQVYQDPSSNRLIFKGKKGRTWAEVVDVKGSKIKDGYIESGSSWMLPIHGTCLVRIVDGGNVSTVKKILIK